jgi:2-dehydro-3-deoxygluconokinase
MSVDILAMGEPMVEFNQTGADGGRTFLQGFGGDTSNFAVAARRQGAAVGYISALGDDPNGRLMRGLWAAEGVDDSHVRTDPDGFTGIYFVTHGPAGHEFHFYRKGSAAARYRSADVPVAAIRAAKALHLSGISLAISESACDACFAAARAAREGGTLVSFDTNLRLKLWSLDRARAIMTEMIRQSDICLPSHEDVAAITGLSDPDAIVDRLLSLGPRIVALKLGADGALVADGARRIRIPPHPVRPVDATGAGDAFGGAFMARLVAGDDVEAAGRYAAVCAALSTEGYGAVAPVPRAERVMSALR